VSFFSSEKSEIEDVAAAARIRKFAARSGRVERTCHFPGGPKLCKANYAQDFRATREEMQEFTEKYAKLVAEFEKYVDLHPEQETKSFVTNSKLEKQDAAAIHDYTISSFEDLNKNSRLGNVVDDDELAVLVSGLRKLERFVGTAYRSVNLPAQTLHEYLDAFESKLPLKIDSAISASYSSAEMTTFSGNAKIAIRSKSGVIVEKLSQVPSEKGVAFAPGGLYQITKMEKVGDTYTIEMDELAD
jgi:hypothetical protein